MKVDFDENGMTPYQISVKYGVDIEEVWRILESDKQPKDSGDSSEEESF